MTRRLLSTRRARFACSIVLALMAATSIHGQETKQETQQEKGDPTPLADAVIASDDELVRRLVQGGADVQGLDLRPEVAGRNGRRPLNWAALANDTGLESLMK